MGTYLPFKVDLTGKVAVVTGGSGVLCSVMAKSLAACGASVAVLGRRLEAAQAVVDEIIAEGGKGLAVSVNVLDKAGLEAARETARQLRLRNLSGIIVVDFIDMESQDDREELLEVLRQELKKDPVRTVLVDMTPLGLVEITRKKVRKTLKEQMENA